MRVAVLEAIAEQADTVWRAHDYAPAAFADIAASIVEEREGELRSELRDLKQILRWLPAAPWPEQLEDNDYGFPAIAFGRTKRLRAELIFWVDGAIRIHGHRSPGIFYVLHGERLHATYAFAKSDAPCAPGLALGHLSIEKVELLQPGALRKIGPEHDGIHALVPLGRPCVTFSIRALADLPYRIDSDHLLVDVGAPRRNLDRLLHAFSLYALVHPPAEQIAMAREVLERPDADILFAATFLRALRPMTGEHVWRSLLDGARDRFGHWIDKTIESSEHWLRTSALERLLESPTLERGPRLLLGLVFLHADRKTTLDFLERAFPDDDPLRLVDRWMRAIIGPRLASQELSAALGITFESDVVVLLRRFREALGQGRIVTGTPSSSASRTTVERPSARDA
jgi:hypothetical protein